MTARTLAMAVSKPSNHHTPIAPPPPDDGTGLTVTVRLVVAVLPRESVTVRLTTTSPGAVAESFTMDSLAAPERLANDDPPVIAHW